MNWKPIRWVKRRLAQPDYDRRMDAVTDLLGRGLYADVEPRCEEALAFAEATFGARDPELCAPLYALAAARLAQGKTEEAIEPCRRAISIAEEAPRPTEPRLPKLLELLATLHERCGRLEEAERIYRRMLAGYERMRAPDEGQVASVLNRLALLRSGRGEPDEAKALFARAAELTERAFGPQDPALAEVLYNAATHLAAQGTPADSEGMLRRALSIAEALPDQSGELLPSILHNLAVACEEQGRPEDAEALYRRALDARSSELGRDHPSLRPTLARLLRLLDARGQYEGALPILEWRLSIAERDARDAGSQSSAALAEILTSIGDCNTALGRIEEAAAAFGRAADIYLASPGVPAEDTLAPLLRLAALHARGERFAEAERLYLQALRRMEQAADPRGLLTCHSKLATFYAAQGRYADAGAHGREAMALSERTLKGGAGTHAHIFNLAEIYRASARLDEAEALYRRAIASAERSLGPSAPELAAILAGLAALLRTLGRGSEATEAEIRAAAIERGAGRSA